MTMIEVAYQLRDHAKVLVGSEELEPGPGWPYAAILEDLAKSPRMTAPALGATIVRRYVESYRHGAEEATQSAINLGQLGDLVEMVDLLARRLLAGVKNAALVGAVHVARRRSLSFFDGLYVDLHHLTSNLAKAAGQGLVADACVEIQRMTDGQATRGPIIAAGQVGPRMMPSRGLSIYFPAYRDPSIHYRELDFATRTAWGEFVEVYLSTDRADRPSA
jgi:hypothetical protein